MLEPVGPGIGSCPALVKKRCSGYEGRPLICRLFGVAEGMPCPYGCKPFELITDKSAALLLREVKKI